MLADPVCPFLGDPPLLAELIPQALRVVRDEAAHPQARPQWIQPSGIRARIRELEARRSSASTRIGASARRVRGPHKRSNEARARIASDPRRGESSASCRACSDRLAPTRRNPPFSASRYPVQRAALRVLELVGEHGVNGPPDDRCFDHRRRVDTHHRFTVIERVEVILTIGFVDRVRPVRIHRNVG